MHQKQPQPIEAMTSFGAAISGYPAPTKPLIERPIKRKAKAKKISSFLMGILFLIH